MPKAELDRCDKCGKTIMRLMGLAYLPAITRHVVRDNGEIEITEDPN
jgi:hypothetical protein